MSTAAKEKPMRRHWRKVLFGVTLIVFLSPSECVDFYCSRSDRGDSAPICENDV